MSDAIAPADAVDLTGKTVGDYQVLRKLGQGGMGAVYLARQVSLKREVALKFLRKDLAENAVRHNFVRQLLLCLGVPWRRTCNHFIENYSQRPYIALVAVLVI